MGFRATGISIVSDARINDLIGKVAHDLHTKPSVRITLTTGCTGESGFDPVELWVMGPPCG